MYIYHALINALSAHMIHINLNVIFYTFRLICTYIEKAVVSVGFVALTLIVRPWEIQGWAITPIIPAVY